MTASVVRSSRSWEDFVVGERYRTDALTVTEAHVVNWAGLTGDWVPLHTDAEYAASSAFGQRIAHGPLTLALALGLATRTGMFGDCVLAWLGLDEVRLPRPVLFGDTIHAEVEVTSVRPTSKGNRGIVASKIDIKNQKDEVVITYEATRMLAGKSK